MDFCIRLGTLWETANFYSFIKLVIMRGSDVPPITNKWRLIINYILALLLTNMSFKVEREGDREINRKRTTLSTSRTYQF